jgi:hypothetical protein
VRNGRSGRARLIGAPGSRRSALFSVPIVVCLIAGVFAATASPVSGATPRWKIVASPNPVGSTVAKLESVVCPAANNCFAVGYRSTIAGGNGGAGLVEHWNGRNWSVMTSPALTTAFQLNAVTCPSVRSCFAVGMDTGGELLIEQWNGTIWSSLNIAAAGGGNLVGVFYGVTCRSTASCIAVGFQSGPSGNLSVVEQWTGNSWTTVASPSIANPDPATLRVDTSLMSVSCPSAKSCFAAGTTDSFNSDYSVTTDAGVIEHWNGSTWSFMTIPKLTGNPLGDPVELNGLSCATPSTCIAVGVNSSGFGALAELWNGSRWSVMTTPFNISIAGVSCPTAKSCFASGFGGTKSAAHWNGTRWSTMTTPEPAGTSSFGFLGVACPTATACTAVGAYTVGSNGKPLIERYA